MGSPEDILELLVDDTEPWSETDDLELEVRQARRELEVREQELDRREEQFRELVSEAKQSELLRQRRLYMKAGMEVRKFEVEQLRYRDEVQEYVLLRFLYRLVDQLEERKCSNLEALEATERAELIQGTVDRLRDDLDVERFRNQLQRQLDTSDIPEEHEYSTDDTVTVSWPSVIQERRRPQDVRSILMQEILGDRESWDPSVGQTAESGLEDVE